MNKPDYIKEREGTICKQCGQAPKVQIYDIGYEYCLTCYREHSEKELMRQIYRWGSE